MQLATTSGQFDLIVTENIPRIAVHI